MLESLIKKAEQYLRTDVRYLGSGGFFLSLSQLVSLVATIATTVAFANLLSPEAYGQYRYVIAAAALLGGFSLTGLGTSLIKSIAQGYEGEFQACFKKNFRWSLIGTSLGLVGSLYYFYQGNIYLCFSFILIAITLPLLSSSILYRSFLNGKKEFKKIAQLTLLHRGLQSILIIGTLIKTQEPSIIVAVFFVSETIIQTYFYITVRNKFVKNTQTDPKGRSLGLHISVMNLMKVAGGQADKLIIFQTLGAAPLAIYAFALAPITELTGIDKTISNLALPKLSRRSFTTIQETLFRKVLLLMIFMTFVAIVYILSADLIFTYLFPKYIESVTYSKILSLTLIFTPALILTKAMVAHELTGRLYIIRILTPATQVVLIFLLTSMYGLIGTVGALLAAKIFWFLLVIVLFFKKTTPQINHSIL